MIDINEIDSDEYLFILNDDNIEGIKEIRYDCALYRDDKHDIDLSWSDWGVFDHSGVRIVNDFSSKLCYLFANLHEDTMLTNVVKSIIPDVTSIKTPSRRYCNGKNFQYWQETYGFTIEDFLVNKKYIIIVDYRRSIANAIDLGLFNWKNIKSSSILLDN